MNLLGLLFGFRGRINRAQFWKAVLVFFLISIAYLAGIIWTAGGIDLEDPTRLIDLFFASAPIGFALGLLMIVSGFAVGIKRLHDRDTSGWWYLLFWLGPSIASGLQTIAFDAALKLVFGALSLGIAIWGLIVLGFLRGTRGPNQYGPDPLGLSNEPLR